MLNVIEKEGLFKRDFNLISNVFIFKKEMHSGLLRFLFLNLAGVGEESECGEWEGVVAMCYKTFLR